MEERDIVEVRRVEECDEWDSDGACMRPECDGTTDKVISLEYEGEPDKTFFSALCRDCSAEYVRRWDKAQIHGDQAIN